MLHWMSLVTRAECGAWSERLRHERLSQEAAYLPLQVPGSPITGRPASTGLGKSPPATPCSAASVGAGSGLHGRTSSQGGGASAASGRSRRTPSSSSLRHTATELMGLEIRGSGGSGWAAAGAALAREQPRRSRSTGSLSAGGVRR
mmetsp:Transcript_91884/g.286428  ORF Transcript_91884/g.286428 Transcript_91884/m.286428 type:complete len:146 (+) Transcript_91884:34-471(+)